MRYAIFSVLVIACSCGGDPSLLDTSVVAIRWLDSDVELVELRPGEPPADRGVLAGSNRDRRLERWGLGRDAAYVCTYADDGRLRLFDVATATVIAASEALRDFAVDGCTIDSNGGVLVFSRPSQLVRTYSSREATLMQDTESTFDTGGGLSGPDSLRARYDSGQVVVASAYRRIEVWRPDGGWHRHGVWMGDGRLGKPAVGNSLMAVSFPEEPAIALVSVEEAGTFAVVGRIAFPESILYVAVSPDDRVAWSWSAKTLYVVDLTERAIVMEGPSSACGVMGGDVLPRDEGYELVGRGSGFPTTVRRCWTDEDGVIEGAEDLRVSGRDVIVGVQTQRKL